MTNQMPPLDTPPDSDEGQETTPHHAQRTAPMRPASIPEQSGMNAAVTQPMTPQTPQTTPTRTPPVPNLGTTPPPSGTRAMPAVPVQPARPIPPAPPGGTRAMPPVAPRQGTQPMPAARPGTPPPPRRSAPPPTMYQRKGQTAALTPRDSSLYLPWWSLALMLVGVLVLSFLIVLAIALLGGGANPASRDPIIVIVTAPPTQMGQTSSTGGGQAGSQVLMGQNPPTSLELNGPTLPAVQFTATPVTIEIGKLVIVAGVDGDELNVRDNPGVMSTNVIARVTEGTILTIVDGPRQADGFTWWQIQSADQTIKGWAVSNFLQVTSGGI